MEKLNYILLLNKRQNKYMKVISFYSKTTCFISKMHINSIQAYHSIMIHAMSCNCHTQDTLKTFALKKLEYNIKLNKNTKRNVAERNVIMSEQKNLL